VKSICRYPGGKQVNKISRNTIKGLAAIAVMTLVLTGCSATKSVNFKACAVSDEGSWNDKSFNEAVLDGIKKSKKDLGVKTATAESNTAEDFAPNLQAMVDAKCDVTFAVGFNLVDAVNKAAESNPKMHFVTIDGWSNGAKNLKPVGYAMQESAYLAGYLAASYSKTHVVSTYGGMQIDAVTAFETGFYYGAKRYEKDSGVATTVLGWNPITKTGDFMGDFAQNSAVSKTIAATQIQKGSDVIFPVAGDQFGSVSSAITEAGVDAVMIGVDKNIAKTSPQYAKWMLTSVEKRMTNAVFDIVKSLSGGAKFDGTAYLGNLKNGGTGLSDFGAFDSKISQETKDKLKALTADIESGKIDPTK
jgi:basic membrane protein A and related proteins